MLGDRHMPTKGERQRHAILAALPQLLAHRSIDELTVGEIAEAAGVRRSGFYFYFESKYTALAVATSDIWSEVMDRASAFTRLDNESPSEFLARLEDVAIEAWHTHEAVLVASVRAIPVDAQLAGMWSRWNALLSDTVVAQLLKDQEQGLANPSAADVPLLVANLVEMTIHLFYQDRVNKCDAAETARMLVVMRAIWLASAWGFDQAEIAADAASADPRP